MGRIDISRSRGVSDGLQGNAATFGIKRYLTREICERSSAKFVRWPSASTLCEYLPRSYAYEQQAELPTLTILEVHERYGPGCKEVREYESARVA